MGCMQIVTVSVDFNDPETIGIDVVPYGDTIEKGKNKDKGKVLSAVLSVLGNKKMPRTTLTDETVETLKGDKTVKKKGQRSGKGSYRLCIV